MRLLSYNKSAPRFTFTLLKKMPRKNITTLDTDGLTEAREQIEYSIGMLKALEDLVDASDLDTLDVPYFANFSEAIRRIEVFVSGATQAYHQAMLNKHVRETN